MSGVAQVGGSDANICIDRFQNVRYSDICDFMAAKLAFEVSGRGNVGMLQLEFLLPIVTLRLH